MARQSADTKSVDYRTSACMNAVKSQGSCGSCWSFAANTPVEYQLCKQFGYQVVLSEQQLVDCAGYSYGNYGCKGGWYVIDYIFNKLYQLINKL